MCSALPVGGYRGAVSPSDKVVRQIFEDVLLGGLGGDGVADVERIQGLFGSSVSGPLRELLSRRDGACAFELGPWCVDTAADGYPEAQQRFFERHARQLSLRTA